MKIPTHILVPLQNKQANTSSLWLDINFIDSFCAHLKGKNIKFKRLRIPISEDGRSENLKIEEAIGNEIVMEYTGDIGNLMHGWDMKTQ